MKDLVVLGGPNGAGKTSAAASLFPINLGIREFVNADEIARGLSPFNPEGSAMMSGRVMIERIRNLARVGESFAFETTCAGRSHLQLLADCRRAGYRLTLIFLWLPSPEAALSRVARRAREGGHSLPAGIVVRRYHSGLRNMRHLYLPAVDLASIFDNSDGAGHLIAERTRTAELIIHDAERWAMIDEATR